ncbi:C39 family peptidase [Aerococcaceae bacterium DSM 111020]|nr:C39 family peptidase [Aerococcaceae bacterium DSM 111020]
MQNNKLPNRWLIISVVALMLLIASVIVFLLTTLNPIQETEVAVSNEINKQSSEIQEPSEESSIEPTNEDIFTHLLSNNNPNSIEGIRTIQQTLTDLLKENPFKELQPAMLQALENEKMDASVEGTNFLPRYPAQFTPSNDNVKQLNIPLIIQTSPQWRSLPYGNTGSQQMHENGCAIVTLAMTKSYLDNRDVTPNDILSWAGEQYFTPDGTSWQIFQDFTIENNYHLENFGNNFENAMKATQEGKPVIVSVSEGQFTEAGHFIIVRGYDEENGLVYINDANDDVKKAFSMQAVDEDVIINEGINYWAIFR